MDRNVGRIDQAIRAVMGLGMLSLIWLAPESGYWGLLGALPLLSAIVGHCPTYRLLGIRTRPREIPASSSR